MWAKKRNELNIKTIQGFKIQQVLSHDTEGQR